MHFPGVFIGPTKPFFIYFFNFNVIFLSAYCIYSFLLEYIEKFKRWVNEFFVIMWLKLVSLDVVFILACSLVKGKR